MRNRKQQKPDRKPQDAWLVRVPKETHEELQKIKAETGIPHAQTIRRLVKTFGEQLRKTAML